MLESDAVMYTKPSEILPIIDNFSSGFMGELLVRGIDLSITEHDGLDDALNHSLDDGLTYYELDINFVLKYKKVSYKLNFIYGLKDLYSEVEDKAQEEISLAVGQQLSSVNDSEYDEIKPILEKIDKLVDYQYEFHALYKTDSEKYRLFYNLDSETIKIKQKIDEELTGSEFELNLDAKNHIGKIMKDLKYL